MAEPGFHPRLGLGLFAAWLAVCALPASARWTTLGELSVHFRPYLGVLGIVLSVLLLGLGARKRAALGALLAAWLLLPMLSLSWPRRAAEHVGPELQVASANLHRARPEQLDLEGWLSRHPVDVLAFQEVTLPTALHLRERLSAEGRVEFLPASITAWGPGTYGQVLFSRLPVSSVERVHEGWLGPGYFSIELRLGDADLRVIAAHPMRPGRNGMTEGRDAAYASISTRAARSPRTLVLGDLNSTEASPAFSRLLEEGRLRDSRAGFGWLPSFSPLEGPLGKLPLLPIDHVLAGEGLVVLTRARTESLGSDHWPITATVALAATH